MFDRPLFLLFLWIIPLLALLIRYAHKKKRQAAERFLKSSMQERLMPRRDPFRILFRSIILLTALS
ncbi:MAG: hypothetical protein LBG58_09610, partial [Planctomycetaceae bacterium]|nr:hypothetical protein [Planctomycetaceae bacterium]